MGIEYDFRDLTKHIESARKYNLSGANVYSYEDAYNLISEELSKVSADKFKVEGDEDTEEYLVNYISRYKVIANDLIGIKSVSVSGFDSDSLALKIARECVGYDILSDLMEDGAVTDIFVYSFDSIFYEKNGVNHKYEQSFRDEEHLDKFVNRLASTSKNQLDKGKNKILDFELYGCRYCATSRAASPESPSLTIRKHPKSHITFDDLLEKKVLSPKMGDFLRLIIKGERNGIVAGITGSGKTTTLRAVLDETITNLNKRALVCEDTQELFLENEQTLSLVSETTDINEKRLNGKLTLADLIVAALRLKPKYAIIGECRDGFTTLNACECMQTGHSTWLTTHSDTPENTMQRFATKYLTAFPALNMEVVERILGSAVDYIICQDDIPGIGRKISFITEISYDYENKRINYKPIYEFDFKKTDFSCLNDIAEDKAKLMMRRGVSLSEINAWRESEGLNV